MEKEHSVFLGLVCLGIFLVFFEILFYCVLLTRAKVKCIYLQFEL